MQGVPFSISRAADEREGSNFELGICCIMFLLWVEFSVQARVNTLFHSDSLFFYFQIQVTSAPTSEREESGYSTPHSKTTPPPESGIPSITNPWPTPCSQFGVLAIRSSSLALSSETSLMDMAQYTEVWPSPFKRHILIFLFHLYLSAGKKTSRMS